MNIVLRNTEPKKGEDMKFDKKNTTNPTNTCKKPGHTRMLRKGSRSCFTRGIRRVTRVTNPVISHDWVNDIRGHLWHIYSITVNLVMVATTNYGFQELLFKSYLVYSFIVSYVHYSKAQCQSKIDLVWLTINGISVLQMTTDMFHLS